MFLSASMNNLNLVDYEVVLQDNLNLENFNNLLNMKKHLISKAAGINDSLKYKKVFAHDIVSQLKAMNV